MGIIKPQACNAATTGHRTKKIGLTIIKSYLS